MKWLLILLMVSNQPKPKYIPYFNQGQIFRDYKNNLTLRVIDAVALNKAMAWDEQGFINYTPRQIDSIFFKYCKIYKP